MAFCEEADLRGYPKNSVLCEHFGRKFLPGPPSGKESHAVWTMKPRVWNKRLEWQLGKVKHERASGVLGSWFFVCQVGYQKSGAWDKRVQTTLGEALQSTVR